MISARFIAAVLLGVFSFALGCFALGRDRNARINKNFAAYCFVVSVWCVAPGFVVDFLPHGPALFCYRLIQMALPLHAYFFMCFVQDFADVYDQPASRRIRFVTLASVFVLLPFYPTTLVIKDFIKTDGFQRLAGPLYLWNIVLFLVLFLIALGTALRNLLQSSGVKRNQMKFLLLAVVLAVMAIVAYFLSFISHSISIAFFFIQIAANFCIAYTMFKHQLFDFGVVMRRVSIYAGVYLVLLSLPLFIYFPLRDWLFFPEKNFWLRLTAITTAYGFMFSLAPLLTSYLRHKAEQKRWLHLQQQLDFVRESSEALADETGNTPAEIAARIADVIKELYFKRLKTPLRFVFTAIKTTGGPIATAHTHGLQIEEGVLSEFLSQLDRIPPLHLQLPFSERDIAGRLADAPERVETDVTVIRKYLKANEIDLCCPCIHDGKLYGVILLGPKDSGIFSAEELATLQMAAGTVATAVRKSELIERTKELHNLDQLKQELISNITHEFKLPLANVDAATTILLDKVKSGQFEESSMTEFINMIRTNSSRLGFYIQDLLSIARIEQARVDLELEHVPLNDLLQECVATLKPAADAKNLKLEIAPAEQYTLPLDREKMRQVITNLISNAVKFTDKGGVSVALVKVQEGLRIVVEDTGRGIEAVYLSSVFDKFFRAPDAQNRKTKGTGLGLAIAKGWTEAHGGRIWVESGGIGKGSRFIVELSAF